jgi:hypothetical protein
VFSSAVQAEFYSTLKVGPDRPVPTTLHQFTLPTNRLPQSTYSAFYIKKDTCDVRRGRRVDAAPAVPPHLYVYVGLVKGGWEGDTGSGNKEKRNKVR